MYKQLSEYPDREFEIVLCVKVEIAPIKLAWLLGEPTYSFSDAGAAVTKQWLFSDGVFLFTVYDYKSTSLYNGDPPRPSVFWNSWVDDSFSIGTEQYYPDINNTRIHGIDTAKQRGMVFYAWLFGRLYQADIAEGRVQS